MSHRNKIAGVLLALCVSTPAQALETKDLAGQWTTQGGTLFTIDAKGRATIDTPSQGAVGLVAKGDVLFDKLRIDAKGGAKATLNVFHRPNGTRCSPHPTKATGRATINRLYLTRPNVDFLVVGGRCTKTELADARQRRYTRVAKPVELRFVDRQGVALSRLPVAAPDNVAVGFHLEVRFERPPRAAVTSLTVALARQPAAGIPAVTVTLGRTADRTTFRSPWIALDRWRPKSDETLTATHGALTASVTWSSACEALVQGGATTVRHSHLPWVWNLLCDYMMADFEQETERQRFVTRVLGHLRAHATNLPGGGTLNPAQTITGVVTDQPIDVFAPDGPDGEKRKEIKGMRVVRSRLVASRAVVGLNANRYLPKKDLTNADEKALDAVAVAGAKAITLLLLAKVVADQIPTSDVATSREDMVARARPLVKRFIEAALPKLHREPRMADKLIARVGAVQVAPQLPPYDQARVLRTHPPNSGEVRLGSEETVGKPIGAMRAETVVNATKPEQRRPKDMVEAIEPLSALKKSRRMVSMAVLLGIRLHVIQGVTDPEAAIKNGRIAVQRVRTKDPADDANDANMCTRKIDAHEQRHATDTWTAWQRIVIEGAARRLMSYGANAQQSSLVRQVATQRVDGSDLVVLQLRVTHVFADERTAKAVKARMAEELTTERLKNAFVCELLAAEVERREDLLHATQAALDDACRYQPRGSGYPVGKVTFCKDKRD